MTEQMETTDTVRKTITVAAPLERAFEVFAARIGSWWPKEYSILEGERADVVIEPKAGGRWYEVGADGKQCDTGTVLVYEPPSRLTLAWHLNGQFQYDPDPDHASEVDIRFVSAGEEHTLVEVEHRHFERHGDGAAAVRGAVESEGGWGYCLDTFATQFAA